MHYSDTHSDFNAGASPKSEGDAPSSSASPEFVSTAEAADFLRLSPRTLEKMRLLGSGPEYRKFGARVLYAVGDLRSWADSRAFQMTSDPGNVQRRSVR